MCLEELVRILEQRLVSQRQHAVVEELVNLLTGLQGLGAEQTQGRTVYRLRL